MHDLKYYNDIATPHKTLAAFKNELDSELDSFVGTRKQIKEEEDKIHDKATTLYNENQHKRSEEKRAKMQEFKKDLAEENGVVDHPKLDKLFEKVWDTCHDSGLREVVDGFEFWVELIKE